MKASKLSTMFAAVLLLAASAWAGETVKKSLQINEKVDVQGTQLTPGTYTFEWSGSGPEVQVSIFHRNDKLATVPAHMVQEGASHEQTGYAMKAGPNGQENLSEIFFSGEKFNLELQAGGHSASNSGASPSR